MQIIKVRHDYLCKLHKIVLSNAIFNCLLKKERSFSLYYDMASLAIDVGSSYTCACITSSGDMEMVKDLEDPLIPSVIRYNNNGSV